MFNDQEYIQNFIQKDPGNAMLYIKKYISEISNPEVIIFISKKGYIRDVERNTKNIYLNCLNSGNLLFLQEWESKYAISISKEEVIKSFVKLDHLHNLDFLTYLSKHFGGLKELLEVYRYSLFPLLLKNESLSKLVNFPNELDVENLIYSSEEEIKYFMIHYGEQTKDLVLEKFEAEDFNYENSLLYFYRGIKDFYRLNDDFLLKKCCRVLNSLSLLDEVNWQKVSPETIEEIVIDSIENPDSILLEVISYMINIRVLSEEQLEKINDI